MNKTQKKTYSPADLEIVWGGVLMEDVLGASDPTSGDRGWVTEEDIVGGGGQ